MTTASFDSLLADPEIEDLVCKESGVFCFKKGSWHGPYSVFESRAELEALSRRIAERAGSRIGVSNPTLDTQLYHEASRHSFRAHVVSPPMTPLGVEITLRRLPSIETFSLDDFSWPSLEMRQTVESAAIGKHSIMVSGATGSGKTSLLTALMRLFETNCRTLLLEDCAELPLPNALSTRLLTRKDLFGFRDGAVWDLEHLVFESLRMRPERLILGECRGREASAILKALSTGHRGLMTTLHAGSCSEALSRFFTLAESPVDAKAWDIVIFLQIDERGQRHVREVRTHS